MFIESGSMFLTTCWNSLGICVADTRGHFTANFKLFLKAASMGIACIFMLLPPYFFLLCFINLDPLSNPFLLYCPAYAPFILKVHQGSGRLRVSCKRSEGCSLQANFLNFLSRVSLVWKEINKHEMSAHVLCFPIQFNYLIPLRQPNVDLCEK